MSHGGSQVDPSFFEMLFAHTGVALIGTDASLLIRVWNQAATEVFGLEPEAARGRPVTDLVPPELRGLAERLFRRALTSGAVNELEMTHTDAQNREQHLAVTISPVTDPAGRHIGVSACVRNITPRVMLQRKLARNQKMASLGSLAGSIAHHFNNLLGGIVTSVDYARASGDLAAARRALDTTAKSVSRAAKLTEHLLMFAEGDRRETDLADLTETVLHFVEAAEPTIKARNIRLDVALSPVPVIPIPAARMLTVLQNLLDNALEATPAGGWIEIRLEPDGEKVRLRMADSGEGVRAENLDRIFEPFFSTRTAETSCGRPHAGLGLAAAHGMIRDLGGEISVRSEPGRGTTFDIILPTHPAGPQ